MIFDCEADETCSISQISEELLDA